MTEPGSGDDRLGDVEEIRLQRLVERALETSDDLADLSTVETRFVRSVRLVREAAQADLRDGLADASPTALQRACELASLLPSPPSSDLGETLAAWWSRVRSSIAECVYQELGPESGRLAGAGLRGTGTRGISYAVAEGAAACEIDLEIAAAGDAGRCRVHGQIHPTDESIAPAGVAVVAIAADGASPDVEPVASGVVDREGFFELSLPPGRYDLAFAIGRGPAAMVADLEVP